jgi:3-hydroxyacyl-CoA dehydrogenase
MSDLVQVTNDNGIAVITINNPPVNAHSAGVPEGIAAASELIYKDDSIKAAVLIGEARLSSPGRTSRNSARSLPARLTAVVWSCLASLENRRLWQAHCHGHSWQRLGGGLNQGVRPIIASPFPAHKSASRK